MAESSEDTCRPVEVDGEVVRVLGRREMDATERDAFADLVRAAKRRFATETCPQELCRNWTGDGCACALIGLAPEPVEEDEP